MKTKTLEASAHKQVRVFGGLPMLITAVVIVALLVILPDVNLFDIMMSAQVINGVLLPVLLVFLVLIARDKRILGRFRNGRVWNVLTWATIVLITVLTVVMFVLQALGF